MVRRIALVFKCSDIDFIKKSKHSEHRQFGVVEYHQIKQAFLPPRCYRVGNWEMFFFYPLCYSILCTITFVQFAHNPPYKSSPLQ